MIGSRIFAYYVAEHVHKSKIQTDCLAEKIVLLNNQGEEDTVIDGAQIAYIIAA
jgi:hypothetical protein